MFLTVSVYFVDQTRAQREYRFQHATGACHGGFACLIKNHGWLALP
jgi:hypothetical protein